MTQKVYLTKKAIFIYQKEVFFVMLSPSEEAQWFDAESFEAYGHKDLIKLYGISGTYKFQSTVERILADINEGQGFADDEYYFLTEKERDEFYDEKFESFDAESFEAEIPKSVKMGFGFATGLALFQIAVIAGAIGIGMLMEKDE